MDEACEGPDDGNELPLRITIVPICCVAFSGPISYWFSLSVFMSAEDGAADFVGCASAATEYGSLGLGKSKIGANKLFQ